MENNFDLKAFLKNNTLLNESLQESSDYSSKQKSILDAVKGDDVYGAVKDSIDSSDSPNISQLEGILDKAGYTQDEIDKVLGEGKKESSKTMKLSELKAQIREELALSLKNEAEEDEEDAPEADIDIDAELDIEAPSDDEPAMDDDEDPFGGDEDGVEGAEKKAYDAIIAAGQAYKALGEEDDNGGLKTMIDQLSYLDRVYNYPPKEDVFNTDEV